jgi:hypothetical protein
LAHRGNTDSQPQQRNADENGRTHDSSQREVFTRTRRSIRETTNGYALGALSSFIFRIAGGV